MRRICIADMTIREAKSINDVNINFKEKMEIAKNLDKIGVCVVEMPKAVEKTDSLLIKSLSNSIKNTIVSVEAGLSKDEIDAASEALADIKNKRIHLCVPTSPVQMEFFVGMKPAKIVDKIAEMTAYAKTLCDDIEISCVDATRSEIAFLANVIERAIEAGATVIDLCDTAGTMMPSEMNTFLDDIRKAAPSLGSVKVSVTCGNALHLANANSIMAIRCGADQVKTALYGNDAANIEEIVNFFAERGESIDTEIGVKRMELNKICRQMPWLNGGKTDIKELYAAGEERVLNEEFILDENADIAKVIKVTKKLGYDLSDDDSAKVYKEFKRVAAKKKIGAKEMEAIIATTALQVPPTYTLVDFVINSGNIITPTAQVTLEKDGNKLKGLSTGDGPIAAAFLAVEMVVGHHYELDDFQIQSITEGSEAVGNAIVKLRDNGKLYSGNGISTDIIGASIRAYLNAINKIVRDESKGE